MSASTLRILWQIQHDIKSEKVTLCIRKNPKTFVVTFDTEAELAKYNSLAFFNKRIGYVQAKINLNFL